MSKPRAKAWMPPDYAYGDVTAMKELAEGVAGPEAQKRALNWIVTMSGAYDLSYRSDVDGGDRETAFAEGKRFVGLQVVKLINMPGVAMEKLRNG